MFLAVSMPPSSLALAMSPSNSDNILHDSSGVIFLIEAISGTIFSICSSVKCGRIFAASSTPIITRNFATRRNMESSPFFVVTGTFMRPLSLSVFAAARTSSLVAVFLWANHVPDFAAASAFCLVNSSSFSL